MICALAPDRADQAFSIPILPGRAVRCGPVPDPHCAHTSLECNTECSVVVANEIFRCTVPRKRFGDLARQPLGRRIVGHRETTATAAARAREPEMRKVVGARSTCRD